MTKTNMTKTAPERVYLLVSDNENDNDRGFPTDKSEVLWNDHSTSKCEVEYVRSDLVIPKMKGRLEFNRVGKIVLAAHFVEMETETVQLIFNGCFISKAEHRYGSDTFHYTIHSSELPLNPKGSIIPSYDVLIHTSETGKKTREFKLRK